MHKPGIRIAAIRDANDKQINLYGRGVYAGDFPRPGSGNWSPDGMRMAENAIRGNDRNEAENEAWVRDFNARAVADGKVTQQEADQKLAEYLAKRKAERAKPMAQRVDELLWGMASNPRMDLDGGGTVWGCECWWMPEERFETFAGGRAVVLVPLPVRTPKRVQRTRKAGQPGIPPGAVYVGRGPGSKWGNPFTVADCLEAEWATTIPEARKVCTEMFRYWLECDLGGIYGPAGSDWSREAAEQMRAALPELRGKDLACWCPLPEPGQPDHCHAAVLIEYANRPNEPHHPNRSQQGTRQ